MPRLVLAAVRVDYGDCGLQRPVWSPGGLPMADGRIIVVDLAAEPERELIGELSRRLELLVDELDSQAT